MDNNSSGSRKPRIRKAVPTVREKIEIGAQKAEAKPRVRRPLSILWRALKSLLSPLLPVVQVILKPLSWLVPRYFINSWRELRQVTWPNRRETWRLTAAVMIFAIVFGALIAVVDLGLDQIFKRLILR